MPVTAASVAYVTAGSLILYSGIKGATLSATVKAVLAGNLTLADTEKLGTPRITTVSDTPGMSAGSATTVSSGKDSANYITIAKYLVSNGYSAVAAAGITGCIAGESSGNPEAVGAGSYGLIQEQGSEYSGLVTGNATKDLDTQLQAIITYNNAQGQGLIAMLNALTDPVAAADFYSENFERPLVKDSDVVPSVAKSVYAELQGAT